MLPALQRRVRQQEQQDIFLRVLGEAPCGLALLLQALALGLQELAG